MCYVLLKLGKYVRFEIFIAVTMKNAVFWDVVPCKSSVNRRFGGTYRLHLKGRKIREQGTNVSRWLQTEPPVENIALLFLCDIWYILLWKYDGTFSYSRSQSRI
jgi:hypothetical protein